MKLTEYEGKMLFAERGIAIPRHEVVRDPKQGVSLDFPLVLKSQVHTGDRRKKGGILFVNSREQFAAAAAELFAHAIDGERPEYLLAEEQVDAVQELYVSFSYAGDTQGPALSLNVSGGSGIRDAITVPVDLLTPFNAEAALARAGIAAVSAAAVVEALWKLFAEEKLLLAEINPLFVRADGTAVAGDAKLIRDDEVVRPAERRFIEMDGDIAFLASGGGASMLTLDALMRAGGRPANYTEYSGNPPAYVVEELTKKVLSRPGLRGCFVVGAAANFTDIYETLSGFLAGLRAIRPKPVYPIVIRRDGPRKEEAFAMLRQAKEQEGFDLHLYGSETSMVESAKIMAELANATK